MSLEQLTREAKEEIEGRFMTEDMQLALAKLIPSLAKKAYLQGIRDAKGCISEEMFAQETDSLKKHYNMPLKGALEAITRLEEGYGKSV